ncbi:hypothetical protein BST43_08480 [Mycobacteroides saopaulense]|uniref:Uncharacterized protein n=1 Tax=Mycobacteroides saopaulense TaxID=1578165 RepID=A0A1X0JA50_9MYCO|nr:hypothetical protein [Mycobacteroides saopaulense]ORB58858.1 hypothetical protein BST43_08480 [Mycobacteroides saopaulense]
MTTTFVGIAAIVAMTLIGIGMNAGLFNTRRARQAIPPLVARAAAPVYALNRRIGNPGRAVKQPEEPESLDEPEK